MTARSSLSVIRRRSIINALKGPVDQIGMHLQSSEAFAESGKNRVNVRLSSNSLACFMQIGAGSLLERFPGLCATTGKRLMTGTSIHPLEESRA